MEGSEVEALATQFELHFTLFSCMVSSMEGSGWFLDSGASFHMTIDKSLFSNLEEKDLQILIAMRNDEKYNVSGVGTFFFKEGAWSSHYLNRCQVCTRTGEKFGVDPNVGRQRL